MKWKTFRSARDKLWTNYYTLCSSEKYKDFWKKTLLESVGIRVCPIFYQFIADDIIEQLPFFHFPNESRVDDLTEKMDSEDLCAVRYTALGYKIIGKEDKTICTPEISVCLAKMADESESGTYYYL